MNLGDLTNTGSVPSHTLPPSVHSDVKPNERFRIGHIQPIHPPTLTQIAIRELLKNIEIKASEGENRFVPHLKESTALALSRIDALFDAIYQSECVTEKDGWDIEALSATLVIIQKDIENSRDLSRSERKEEMVSLGVGKRALNELRELVSTLDRLQPLEDELQQCFDSISDQIYTPEFEGDTLLAASFLKSGIKSLKSLFQNATTSIKGTMVGNVSQEKFS